jgi:hypothetical protein
MDELAGAVLMAASAPGTTVLVVHLTEVLLSTANVPLSARAHHGRDRAAQSVVVRWVVRRAVGPAVRWTWDPFDPSDC